MKADPVIVAGVSGGPDSVYLLHELVRTKEGRIVVGHVNYGARGKASDEDQKLVEVMSESLCLEKRIHLYVPGDPAGPTQAGRMKRTGTFPAGREGKPGAGTFPPGFEEKARKVRYAFLKRLAGEVGAGKIAMAHTADDQVETVLMRVFEGAGIAGLKGIPRETADGIVRPILDVWKEDIQKHLKKQKIPYRVDASNADTRFERNWVRGILIPLLEKRYGKGVKKRIFAMGERFREIDDYLEAEGRRWVRRNVNHLSEWGRSEGVGSQAHIEKKFVFRRKSFSALPSVLRVKILQRICFDRLGVAPNERLLKAMDRLIKEGGSSARLSVGSDRILENRYEEARFEKASSHLASGKGGKGKKSGPHHSVKMDRQGKYAIPFFVDASSSDMFLLKPAKKISPAQAKRLAAKGDAEVFDAAGLALPLTVRPLRAGDRIRPFGLTAGKKVKEILIDRKVPRGERWGRPVVCDAERRILWIPGILRSAHAPVTPETRTAVVLRVRAAK